MTGLDRSVGFMMGITYRRISALLQRRLKAYDITPEQWSVLYQIVMAEGLIQKEIAERVNKDKPATTRILDHLEKGGLIYKQMGPRDRRTFVVYAAEKGKQLIEKTTNVEQQVIQEIKQCVTEGEYDLLLQLLDVMNKHVSHLMEREKE